MKPEHEERFRRIAIDYRERPGGDYSELLRHGQVSSPEGVDPEEWRAQIRAKARADKIRVVTIRSGDRAIAARHRRIPKRFGLHCKLAVPLLFLVGFGERAPCRWQSSSAV